MVYPRWLLWDDTYKTHGTISGVEEALYKMLTTTIVMKVFK